MAALGLNELTHWGRDKCIPNVRIINIPALVQIMAWRRWGNKPLSEPMMVRLPTIICVTLPQWVKLLKMCTQHGIRLGNWEISYGSHFLCPVSQVNKWWIVSLILYDVMESHIVFGRFEWESGVWLKNVFKNRILHYNDVKWPSWHLQLPVNKVFVQPFFGTYNKGISKFCVNGPLLGESTDDFMRGIHWWPVDSPHKGPVTWKMVSFDDVIMSHQCACSPKSA